MDDGDVEFKIEAAKDLLEVADLPVFYVNKAKNALCQFYTESKQYEEAKPMCEYIISNRQSLDESIDVADAYCRIATGYLAEEKYEDAKHIIQEGLKGNEHNRKVWLVLISYVATWQNEWNWNGH